MRGLVALVSVMSILIVAGLGLVVYGLATKLGSESLSEIPALTLPKGSDVTGISEYKGNLALLVEKNGGQAVYIVDPKTGRALVHMPVDATGASQKQ